MRRDMQGQSLPMGISSPRDIIISEEGDFEASDGSRVIMTDTHIVLMASYGPTEVIFGVTISKVLDAIQKQRES